MNSVSNGFLLGALSPFINVPSPSCICPSFVSFILLLPKQQNLTNQQRQYSKTSISSPVITQDNPFFTMKKVSIRWNLALWIFIVYTLTVIWAQRRKCWTSSYFTLLYLRECLGTRDRLVWMCQASGCYLECGPLTLGTSCFVPHVVWGSRREDSRRFDGWIWVVGVTGFKKFIWDFYS